MVHVLIVPSWYRSSKTDTQGSFFREQAIALKKRGHQVGIIYPQHRSMRQWKSTFTGPYGFAFEDDRGIPTLRMHTMTWFPRQFPYLNYWLWVRNGLTLYRSYVDKFGVPEVVHAHGMIYGGLLAWNIQTQYKVPFVVTEHGTAYARSLFAPWELKLAARAAAAANVRLAVSEAFCEELHHFIGSWWEPCPNVVPSRFTKYDRPNSSSDEKAFVFTDVAYLSKRKGIHHLITAFAAAFGEGENVVLKIGGDGKERASLEALAKQLGVSDRVVFLGALDREGVRDLMAQTDVFVLASQYETFGVVVIEALALGKPVIATKCGGPNLVVREQDGLLVEPEDVGAMTQALLYMKNRINDYDSQEIRSACVARYGEQALVDRLVPRYESVSIGQKAGGADESAKDLRKSAKHA